MVATTSKKCLKTNTAAQRSKPLLSPSPSPQWVGGQEHYRWGSWSPLVIDRGTPMGLPARQAGREGASIGVPPSFRASGRVGGESPPSR